MDLTILCTRHAKAPVCANSALNVITQCYVSFSIHDGEILMEHNNIVVVCSD